MQHPDVSAALSTGYATFQAKENKDTLETRFEFLEEHQVEFLKWIRDGYPDLMEEFIEFGRHYHKADYQDWLN